MASHLLTNTVSFALSSLAATQPPVAGDKTSDMKMFRFVAEPKVYG